MKYKVVVADDEPIMRKAMQTLVDWKALDCELVCLFANGKDVLRELSWRKPDILILDIQMPEVSGMDIAKYVWENHLPCKVILLTAYADFSYAQSAIRYHVVDYVVKNGAFDELVAAVEKAKTQICEETEASHTEENIALKENFFKAVFDGSLYEKNEMMLRAEKAGLSCDQGYWVIVIYFTLKEKENRDYAYKNIQDFLHTVFEQQMVYGSAVLKNLFVAVIKGEEGEKQEDEKNNLDKKCKQILEIMSGLMRLYVGIGIGNRCDSLYQLKNSFEQAEYTFEEKFFAEKGGITYYEGMKRESLDYIHNQEKIIYQIKTWIRKGNREEALACFSELLSFQKEQGAFTHSVLATGIEIQRWCRRELGEYDKSIYDICPYQPSISKMIYQCRHVLEYQGILETIIGNSADTIHTVVSRKSVIIYECQRYVEENFQKCISVTEIAREIGASLSYLSRIFKETTGITIIQFINNKKIEKAKEYLDKTDMKIYEIADMLGFENTTYFSSFFKKHTGMSPKTYSELRFENQEISETGMGQKEKGEGQETDG